MTKNSLWKTYTHQNPKWLTDGASLTPAGLQKLFDQVWMHAHKAGVEEGIGKGLERAANAKKILDQLDERDGSNLGGEFSDILGDIFSGKGKG